MNLLRMTTPLVGTGAYDFDKWALRTIGGNYLVAATALTRPANTDAYTAKDVVGPAVTANLTFTNVAREVGGSGKIVKACLFTDQSANVARYRLHLYHTAPVAIADNAPMAILWVKRASRVGYIDFAAAVTEGTGSDMAYSLNAAPGLPFVCVADSRNLLGVLEALDAFTPASSQGYYIELTAETT